MQGYLMHKETVVTTVDKFDFAERIKPSAVMEYFQDMATAHAEEIGIGFAAMKSKGQCWVLHRLSAVIDRQPTIGEAIDIVTYPHKPGMVDAVRDYYITDKDGQSLIRGTSRWCVLDIASKAIRRCAPLFSYADDVFTPEEAVPDGNPQLPDVRALSMTETARLTGTVHITDLDRNGHMNNARYGDVVVNTCPYDLYKQREIQAFDINFLSEMMAGEPYTVLMKTDGKLSYFEANGETHTRPIFRAAVRWK